MEIPSKPLEDLLGRRHTYLRVSVTDRCNLRCRYCTPPEDIALLPRSHILTFEEIERLAHLFVSLGVTKIRITGGEPMVRREILSLLQALGAIPGLHHLAMTTNGSRIARHLQQVHAAGVTALNFSLDTFRKDRYRLITRRDGLDQVLQAIHGAVALPFQDVKINCVVMRGVNDDEVLDFVAFTRDHQVTVRFIEYMPFGHRGWDTDRLVPYQELLQTVRKAYPLEPAATQRPGETARRFVIPGHAGEVGFITPMTNHFCGACNRLRLTADGVLKNCLFHRGSVNLRTLIRAGASNQDLEAAIRQAVVSKRKYLGGHQIIDHEVAESETAMVQVGG